MKFAMLILVGAFMTLFSALALAAPANDPVTNICAWVGGIPKLYTEYHDDACPPKHRMKANGECDGWDHWRDDCASFCEVRTTFAYGPEQPFLRAPSCRGPLTCKISYGIHQGYAFKAKTNGAYKVGPLNIGITGGFNLKYSKGISQSFTAKLDSGQCGYFTFVAIIRTTCGTYTGTFTGVSSCYPSRVKTTGNACIDQVARFNANDGFPDEDVTRGIVIFVYTDCVTMDPLPDDQQDPAYRQPGVKLPRGAIQQGYAQWFQRNIDAFTASSTTCTSDKQAKRDDCLDALGQMLDAPLSEIPDGKKGDRIDITSSGNCKVWFEYADDIKDSCGSDAITWVELAAAAQGIHDNCPDGKGHVGGKHRVGTTCKGTVIMNNA